MTKKQWVITKKGNQFQVLLPAKRIVCPTCDGEGRHVNRAIDGNGISAEEFAEDPDFMESYMAGHYDVRCEECNGKRVIEEIDTDALTPKMLERYYRALDEEQAHRAEMAAERRIGC
jgi:hypothetical protein